jgi:hypothetical protein
MTNMFIPIRYSVFVLFWLMLTSLLNGCANRPLQPSELSGDVWLKPDEAIVIVRLNRLSPGGANGLLNFHFDGSEDKKPSTFRSPDNWWPMFSVPGSSSGVAIWHKVKAGTLSLTQFNVGRAVGYINAQYSTFAKAGTITYIGDVDLKSDGFSFSFRVFERADAPELVRTKFPLLFDRYPFTTRLLARAP